jgi:hypothetical protein
MNFKKISFSLAIFFVLSTFAFAGGQITKRAYVFMRPVDINMGNSCVTWVDLPAASTASVLSTVSIATATLVANGTSYTLAAADYTDIVFPRNLTVDVAFSSGEATTTVTGNLVITGLDQFGKNNTETISISTNSANGVVTWSTVTTLQFSNVTIAGASVANASLSVGSGNVIALPDNIQSSSDIIKVIENGATSTTYIVNTTYDSIDFASDPDGSKDYYIYQIKRSNDIKYKY